VGAARTAAARVVLAAQILVVLHAKDVLFYARRAIIIAHCQLRRCGIPKTKTPADGVTVRGLREKLYFGHTKCVLR